MTEEIRGSVKWDGLREGARDWERLGNEIRGAKEEADESGGAFDSLTFRFNQATQAASTLFNAAGQVLNGLKSMGDEMERVAGISNRFTGNIESAAQRTNGLITELDLMIASNSAARAGLALTGDEFANVAVAASEFAAATGGDAREAMEKLTRAVAMGEEGALREFGITLGDAKTQVDRQRAALDQLSETYGDMESSADTLGGRIAVLENRIEDATNQFITTIERTGALERAFDELIGTTDELGSAFDDSRNDIDEWAIGTGAAIEATAKQWTAYIDTLSAVGDATAAFVRGNNEAFVAALIRAEEAIEASTNEAFAENLLAAAEEARRSVEKGGRAGTPGGTKGRRGGSGGGAAEESNDKEKLLELQRQELELEDAIADAAAERGKAEAQAAQIIAEREEAQRRILEMSEREVQAKEKLREIERERLDFEKEVRRKLERDEQFAIEIEEQRAKATERSAEGFRGILDIGLETARLVKESNASIGEAFKTAIDEWLKSFALQEAYKGIAALAEAIGSTVTNQPNAAAKFAEAGIHFGLAAAAGGASLAIPNSSGGGGGGASRPEPVGGGGGGGGGGGTTVININNPVARSEAGKEQARADRAHRNRNG